MNAVLSDPSQEHLENKDESTLVMALFDVAVAGASKQTRCGARSLELQTNKLVNKMEALRQTSSCLQAFSIRAWNLGLDPMDRYDEAAAHYGSTIQTNDSDHDDCPNVL